MLTWKDIDFANQIIHVERERIVVPDLGMIEDTPKTSESVRTISVPACIMDMLADLRKFQLDCKEKIGDEYDDSGYVVTTIYGTPHRAYNTYQWFKRFQTRHGLKDATVHDLRHTHATNFIRI